MYVHLTSKAKAVGSMPPLDPLLVHVLVLLKHALALDDFKDLLAHAGLACQIPTAAADERVQFAL